MSNLDYRRDGRSNEELSDDIIFARDKEDYFMNLLLRSHTVAVAEGRMSCSITFNRSDGKEFVLLENFCDDKGDYSFTVSDGITHISNLVQVEKRDMPERKWRKPQAALKQDRISNCIRYSFPCAVFDTDRFRVFTTEELKQVADKYPAVITPCFGYKYVHWFNVADYADWVDVYTLADKENYIKHLKVLTNYKK